MYQVSLKSEGVRPFFVIAWPGITHEKNDHNVLFVLFFFFCKFSVHLLYTGFMKNGNNFGNNR